MPESFTVKLTNNARNDVKQILFVREEYAGKRSANILARRLYEQISNLSLFPFIGRLTEIDALGEIPFRVLVIDTYLCFYVVYGETVFVDHVVDARTDYISRVFGAGTHE
jgi:plasmid stabilization system protein ParE